MRSQTTNKGAGMFMVGVTEWGLKTCKKIQEDYNEESWIPLKRHFQPPPGTWGSRRLSSSASSKGLSPTAGSK